MTHYFYCISMTLCSLLHSLIQNMLYRLICILSSSNCLMPSQKSSSSIVFAFKICLRHQSVPPFLLRKILDPPLTRPKSSLSCLINFLLGKCLGYARGEDGKARGGETAGRSRCQYGGRNNGGCQ